LWTPDRRANGFIIYANLAGHDIDHLNDPSGVYFPAKAVAATVGTNTSYLKVAIQVKEPLPDLTGGNVLQVVIVTMFPENPVSNSLKNSILPNGVDVVGNPLGVAVGVLPPPHAPDKRIPAVASAALTTP
jgi:hypothetical protein